MRSVIILSILLTACVGTREPTPPAAYDQCIEILDAMCQAKVDCDWDDAAADACKAHTYELCEVNQTVLSDVVFNHCMEHVQASELSCSPPGDLPTFDEDAILCIVAFGTWDD